jgi:hypothetical protein
VPITSVAVPPVLPLPPDEDELDELDPQALSAAAMSAASATTDKRRLNMCELPPLGAVAPIFHIDAVREARFGPAQRFPNR